MKKFIVVLFAISFTINLFANFIIYANVQRTQRYNCETYIIDYCIVDEWENNQNITITITNIDDKPITGWALQYDAGGEISNLWNGIIYESNGSKYVIKNSGYNFEIEPNTSITFGYTLSGTNLIIPSEIKLCSNREEKLSGYEVDFVVSNDWGTGFEGEIKISNKTDKAIEAWTVIFNSNFNIDNLWNAKIISQDDTIYELASQQWTTPIEPNSTMILGITASKNQKNTPKMEDIHLTEVVINNESLNNNSDIIIDDEDGGIYYKKTAGTDDVVYDDLGFGYIKNQLLLMVDDNWTFQNVENYIVSLDAKIVGYIDITNEYQIEFNCEKTIDELRNDVSQLEQEAFIEYASLNYYYDVQGAFFPNDTETTNINWNFLTLNTFRAWDYYNEMSRVKIGIIDMIFEDHDDLLFEKIWNNPKKEPNITDEEKQHGTAVAGIMAAIFNNNVGTTGICPKNYLYGYALNTESDTMAQKAAISKLIKKDIKVINTSLSFIGKLQLYYIKNNGTFVEETKDEIKKDANTYSLAFEKLLDKNYDFIIVVAAGNHNINSKYANPLNCIDNSRMKNNIIVVGAIEEENDWYKIWEDIDVYGEYVTSNYGNRVDVVAPGDNIRTTKIGNSYGNYMGSSMAAPHVSGIAGMMYSVNPNISGFEVKEIIKTTSQLRKVADNHGYEYGIADAKLAVSTAYYCNPDNVDKIIFGELKDSNDTSKVYSNTELKVSYSYNGFTTASIISSDENGEFELVIPKDATITDLNIQINGYDVINTDILGQFFGSSAVIEVYIIPIEASIYGTVTIRDKSTNKVSPKAGHTVSILKDEEPYTSAVTQADGTYEAILYEYGDYTVVFDKDHRCNVPVYSNTDYNVNCELESEEEEEDEEENPDIGGGEGSGNGDGTEGDNDSSGVWTEIGTDGLTIDFNGDGDPSYTDGENNTRSLAEGVWVKTTDGTNNYFVKIYSTPDTGTYSSIFGAPSAGLYTRKYHYWTHKLIIETYNSEGKLITQSDLGYFHERVYIYLASDNIPLMYVDAITSVSIEKDKMTYNKHTDGYYKSWHNLWGGLGVKSEEWTEDKLNTIFFYKNSTVTGTSAVSPFEEIE